MWYTPSPADSTEARSKPRDAVRMAQPAAFKRVEEDVTALLIMCGSGSGSCCRTVLSPQDLVMLKEWIRKMDSKVQDGGISELVPPVEIEQELSTEDQDVAFEHDMDEAYTEWQEAQAKVRQISESEQTARDDIARAEYAEAKARSALHSALRDRAQAIGDQERAFQEWLRASRIEEEKCKTWAEFLG